MLESMTGFGKASREIASNKVTVVIKSLNSKSLDLFTKLPYKYREKELEVRSIIGKALFRGKIEIIITLDELPETIKEKPLFNEEQMALAIHRIKEEAQKHQIAEPTNNWFDILVRIPAIFSTSEKENNEISDEEWEMVKQTIEEAISHFTEFRHQEGLALEAIFSEKIQNIHQRLQSIEHFESIRVEFIRNKLEESLNNLKIKDIDMNRLEQELIYYIEKLDINEEKNRLRNHLNYFLQTMHQEEHPGKKLGFIAQEIGREINTLGSKSNQSDMQKIVVEMKDELEQIKEQILNTL